MTDPLKIRQAVQHVFRKREEENPIPFGMANDGTIKSYVALMEYFIKRLENDSEQAAQGELSPQQIVREFHNISRGLGLIRLVVRDDGTAPATAPAPSEVPSGP